MPNSRNFFSLRVFYAVNGVIYTLVEQVRAHGADPYRYLEWVLEKLMRQTHSSADQIDALLPVAWIRLQHAAAGKIA